MNLRSPSVSNDSQFSRRTGISASQPNPSITALTSHRRPSTSITLLVGRETMCLAGVVVLAPNRRWE